MSQLPQRTIRSLVVAAGLTNREIARRHSLNEHAVSDVIAGRRVTPHIRRAIAVELGKPFSDVWGDADAEGVSMPETHFTQPVSNAVCS